MSEFHRAMRAADKKGEMSPNPLNGATLRRIVKSAVRERKRSTKNRTERS